MSEIINFDEVEDSVRGNNTYERKTVDPGVDVFTIDEAELKENTNGKAFIGIKFTNGEGKYFKEQFYMTTPNALKRVKELATNSGVTLGQEKPEDIPAKLIGNKVGLIVGGEKELATIDGREVTTTRAKIKNAYNFSFKANELDKWKDSKITIEDKTGNALPVDNSIPTDDGSDLPF